jgi:NhaA family Na+:H+ antiporter
MANAVIRPIESFFALEAASGILLAFAALLALVWANSPWAESYRALFHAPISVSVGSLWAAFKLDELVNDGLMTVFFLLVGLEIKRELAVGELSSVRKAMLPLIAALGGMLAPARRKWLGNSHGHGHRLLHRLFDAPEKASQSRAHRLSHRAGHL